MGILLFIHLIFHPFYVSVVDMEYNAPARSLETSIRIFTDDLELTLKQNNPGAKIDLFHPTPQTDSLIKNYLTAHLIAEVNGKKMTWKYVGHERISESVWCYMEIENLSQLKTLRLQNSILYDYKKEQINMHHIKANGKSKASKLANPERQLVFTW